MAGVVDSAKGQEWRERLLRLEASGLSVADFCDEEGVSQASVYNWRRRLADGGERAATEAPAFQPLKVVASPPVSAVSVTFENGATMLLPADNLALVRAVAAELCGARCLTLRGV